jgi:alpha-glucosidase
MTTKTMKKLWIYAFLALLLAGCKTNEASLTSPNGKLALQFNLFGGKPTYSLSMENQMLIQPSGMGFELRDMPQMLANFEIVKTDTASYNQTWEQPWGENRYITNHYNELIIHLQEKTDLKRRIDIVFRLFDDGLGFRYYFPEQPNMDSLVIMDEKTEFALNGDYSSWWIPVHADNSYYESLPRHTAISQTDTVNTPLTLKVSDSIYMAIHEANLTDYASMTLLRTSSSSLKSELVPWSNGVKVYGKAPFHTPWRIIITGKNPGDLITSTLMLNLNEPNRIEDTSWIKPQKYIGIWWGMHLEKYTWGQGPRHGATTKNTMAHIDFAADNGFGGVLVEGWNYGWDGDWSKEGQYFSFTKAYPDFDLEKITQHAKSKNVELIGHHETGGAVANYEAQMEEAFKLYHQHGVKTVKTGYVNKYLDGKEWHDGQFGVRHYRKVIETAAKHQIMINNHEPVKPTGLSRTYPNLMTQEGGRGQEYDAWSDDGGNPPAYTTVIPFTRMLAGPFDFTPGTFNFENKAKPNARVQTTLAKQLALFVVIYSPLQMASDLPENYKGNLAFQFIKDVPCDWHKTIVPNGEIGEYVTIARQDRNSTNWFVGAITNEQERTLNLDLSFLQPGVTYQAEIYSDGKDANWENNPKSIEIKKMTVDNTQRLTLWLAPGGGCAIKFQEISE